MSVAVVSTCGAVVTATSVVGVTCCRYCEGRGCSSECECVGECMGECMVSVSVWVSVSVGECECMGECVCR